jgi:DNA-binding PadR family transcriptional regulator
MTILNRKIYRGSILESIFLNLINDASDHGVHGYAIFKAVYKKFGIRLAPSTLYPGLKNLEKQGLIVSNWDFSLGKARKQYRITRKGQTELREYSMELRALIPTVVSCKA